MDIIEERAYERRGYKTTVKRSGRQPRFTYDENTPGGEDPYHQSNLYDRSGLDDEEQDPDSRFNQGASNIRESTRKSFSYIRGLLDGSGKRSPEQEETNDFIDENILPSSMNYNNDDAADNVGSRRDVQRTHSAASSADDFLFFASDAAGEEGEDVDGRSVASTRSGRARRKQLRKMSSRQPKRSSLRSVGSAASTSSYRKPASILSRAYETDEESTCHA